ncbi:hypothetical protein [Microbacterium sp. NPDC055665]
MTIDYSPEKLIRSITTGGGDLSPRAALIVQAYVSILAHEGGAARRAVDDAQVTLLDEDSDEGGLYEVPLKSILFELLVDVGATLQHDDEMLQLED